MKILLITDTFPPESVGGAGQVVFDVAKGFASEGHDVTVLTTTRGNDVDEVSADGYKVIRLGFSYKTKFLRSYLAVYNPFLSGKVKRVIRRENPDVIHCHNLHEFFSFAALKWARCTGAPVFLTAHDVMSFSYTRLDYESEKGAGNISNKIDYRVTLPILIRQSGKSFNPLRNLLIRRFINKNVIKVFAVSAALKEALMQNGIKNAQTLYNGIRASDFDCPDTDSESLKSRLGLNGKKIIFFGGRSMIDKGTLVLVEAFRGVILKYPDACLVMAMDENQHTRHIRNIAKDLIDKQQLILSGLLSGNDLVAMFCSANKVVVPSIYFDPAPLMIMQAMASRRPVVGTSFGGAPEIINNGETGIVVNPNRITELSKAILYILENPERAAKMGDAGFNRLSGLFTLKGHLSETLGEYRAALLSGR